MAAAILAAAASVTPASAADFRVCADPDYLPFSDRSGRGFENQVASYVASVLGERLVYVWRSTRGPGGFDQFVDHTLNKKLCDVVMDVPYASDTIAPSDPYYISSYVFVFPKRKHYDIQSMDSPVLKELKIGFEADTPGEDGLKMRTLILHAVPFDSADDENGNPEEMLTALEHGRIDVGVTWEPAVGPYLRAMPDIDVVGVPNSRSQGAPEQYVFPMAMGARLGDTATQTKLTSVVKAHKADIGRILARNGVKLYVPSAATAGTL